MTGKKLVFVISFFAIYKVNVFIYNLSPYLTFLQTYRSINKLKLQSISSHCSWIFWPGSEKKQIQSSFSLSLSGCPNNQFSYLKALPSLHLNDLPSLSPPIQEIYVLFWSWSILTKVISSGEWIEAKCALRFTQSLSASFHTFVSTTIL